MKSWIIKTHHKKCILEREFWSNNEKDIVKRTIWRSGSWKITTNDSKIPHWTFTNTPGGDEAKDSVDIYSYPGNFDDSDLQNRSCISATDACWTSINPRRSIDRTN